MCNDPDAVGGGVSMENTRSRGAVASKAYRSCSPQEADQRSSSPSSDGRSGTCATGRMGSVGGFWDGGVVAAWFMVPDHPRKLMLPRNPCCTRTGRAHTRPLLPDCALEHAADEVPLQKQVDD